MIDKQFSEWRRKAIERADNKVVTNFDILLNNKPKVLNKWVMIVLIVVCMVVCMLGSSYLIYKTVQSMPDNKVEFTSYPNYQETTNNYQIGNYNTTNNNINYPIIPENKPLFYVLSVYSDGKWKEVIKSTDKVKVDKEYERLKKKEKYLNLRVEQ